MKTAKTTIKHDAHVAAFITNAVATADKAWDAQAGVAVAQEAPTTPNVNTNDETIVAAPTTPDAPTTGTAATSVQLYTLGAKAVTVRQGATLQGAHLKAGRAWRQAGYVAPSVRNGALEAIAALGATFTKDQALAALKVLADAGQLGCSTPATRFSKFLRSGHLAAVAA